MLAYVEVDGMKVYPFGKTPSGGPGVSDQAYAIRANVCPPTSRHDLTEYCGDKEGLLG